METDPAENMAKSGSRQSLSAPKKSIVARMPNVITSWRMPKSMRFLRSAGLMLGTQASTGSLPSGLKTILGVGDESVIISFSRFSDASSFDIHTDKTKTDNDRRQFAWLCNFVGQRAVNRLSLSNIVFYRSTHESKCG